MNKTNFILTLEILDDNNPRALITYDTIVKKKEVKGKIIPNELELFNSFIYAFKKYLEGKLL
jgi:hypothetical protein